MSGLANHLNFFFPTMTFHATAKNVLLTMSPLISTPVQSQYPSRTLWGNASELWAETNDKGHMPSSTGCNLSFIPGFLNSGTDIGPDNLLLCWGRGLPCAL